MSTSPERSRGESGVTLIELIISLSVLSVALLGTLEVMRVSTLGSADPLISKQAVAVAEAYLEEILLKPYYDPDLGAGGGTCPAAEGSRDLWDNVCDYDGLDDSGARDQADNAISGLSNYRVRVTVDTSANLGALSGAATVVRVDVRVTHTNQADITLSGYRTNF